MVVLVWFIDYLTGEEWGRQKRGCVDQEQPLSTVWRLVNYIYPDCYIVSWSRLVLAQGTHIIENWILTLTDYVRGTRHLSAGAGSVFVRKGRTENVQLMSAFTLNGLHQTSMSTTVNCGVSP